jgi:hypothetical protein
MKNATVIFTLLFSAATASAQTGIYEPSIGISTGLINYEGDLKPNSFTLKNSNAYFSLYVSQPLSAHFNIRGGLSMGKIGASDRDNRSYLAPRNLSFQSDIKEAYAGIEYVVLDLENYRFSPYVFAGVAAFHFNPWTTDVSGNKVYLQPLSTEGQGLAAYPERKVYSLNQTALVYAGGVKLVVTPNTIIGFEFSQRKTFTDYLDDVSSSYVDYDKLVAAKGQLAADIAFRGDELPGGPNYPHEGNQRGTPTEKDWYYMFGVNVQVKLSAIKDIFSNSLYGGRSQQGCPVNF